MPNIKIAPSILSADLKHINKEIRQVDGCSDLIHVDIMDGVFVPPTTVDSEFVKKIKTKVPIEFIGESPAVKDLSGILVKNVNELEVEALPQNLPHEIAVDISSLKNFGDQISIKDIKSGADVKLMAEEDLILATVQEPKSQEEIDADLAEPTKGVDDVEVIEKKKEEALAGGEEEVNPEKTAG